MTVAVMHDDTAQHPGRAPEALGWVVRIVLITPALAMEWLEANTDNRHLRQPAVLRYACDMAARAWLLTGETIVFDANGRVQNGQHRLWACVESCAPFEALVVWGVAPEAFSAVDTGVKRSAIDRLTPVGVSNGNAKAAIARRLYQKEHGQSPYWTDHRCNASNREVDALVFANRELLDAAESYGRRAGRVGIRPNVLAAYLWIEFSRISEADASAFFEEVITLDNPRGNATATLRNALLPGADRIGERRVAVFTIKAWNYWRRRENLGKLFYHPDRPMPEPR